MQIMKKRPGQFDAFLSLFCLGAMGFLFLTIPQSRSSTRTEMVVMAAFLALGVFSLCAALSAVLNGKGFGRVLGVLVLILFFLVMGYLNSLAMPGA